MLVPPWEDLLQSHVGIYLLSSKQMENKILEETVKQTFSKACKYLIHQDSFLTTKTSS